MTTATRLRGAFLMLAGAISGATGAVLAVIGGLSVTFPWNVPCIVIGFLLLFVGKKLFDKGSDF